VDQELSQVDTDKVEQPAAEETAVDTVETPNTEKKQDPWKTAFIVLIGIVLLSAVLIYSTSSRRTEPTMALQTDVNGQPVQPLNPATGVEEERLAAMPADSISNANVSTIPGQLPGGDGYNPWANGGKPPPGAPIGPGGGYMTIPNGGGSQFMPPDCILQPSGIYLCPVPVNANTATVKPSPTPKGNASNANVQTAPTPGAAMTPAAVKPTPTPRTRNTPAPAKTPGDDQQ
jgi:hypothetical protein